MSGAEGIPVVHGWEEVKPGWTSYSEDAAATCSGDEASSQAHYRLAGGRSTAHRMIVGAPPVRFAVGPSEGEPGGGDGEDRPAREAGGEWGVVPGQAGPATA